MKRLMTGAVITALCAGCTIPITVSPPNVSPPKVNVTQIETVKATTSGLELLRPGTYDCEIIVSRDDRGLPKSWYRAKIFVVKSTTFKFDGTGEALDPEKEGK